MAGFFLKNITKKIFIKLHMFEIIYKNTHVRGKGKNFPFSPFFYFFNLKYRKWESFHLF